MSLQKTSSAPAGITFLYGIFVLSSTGHLFGSSSRVERLKTYCETQLNSAHEYCAAQVTALKHQIKTKPLQTITDIVGTALFFKDIPSQYRQVRDALLWPNKAQIFAMKTLQAHLIDIVKNQTRWSVLLTDWIRCRPIKPFALTIKNTRT